jgi:molybdenum cofactor guanylyltransferase
MDAEGWILAGGRSLRMGRDKAGVALGERTLLEHMLDKLRALGLRTRMAGLHQPVNGLRPELFPEVHPDTHPGCGPLSGIETALSRSEAPLALVLGVDLPLLETEFLAWMLQRAGTTGAMATIPRLLGEPQPLCAVYRRELLRGVSDALNAGEYRVMMAVERAWVGAIDYFDTERVAATGAWRWRRPAHWQFMNCNTPEDLGLAGAILASAPML